MGSWTPKTPTIGGTWTGHTDRSIVRTELSAMYNDWTAGRITDDVVRAGLPFCWIAYGSTLEAPEALAMLRAVGPISDTERMPERLRVYQGRVSGEPIGIAWSPDPQVALEYGKRWCAVRASRGADLPAVLWTGTVRGADILMVSLSSSQVVVAPEDVTDPHEISGPVPAVADPWRLASASPVFYAILRGEFERQAAGFVRYMAWRHSAP
jgi:hypothetical protein